MGESSSDNGVGQALAPKRKGRGSRRPQRAAAGNKKKQSSQTEGNGNNENKSQKANTSRFKKKEPKGTGHESEAQGGSSPDQAASKEKHTDTSRKAPPPKSSNNHKQKSKQKKKKNHTDSRRGKPENESALPYPSFLVLQDLLDRYAAKDPSLVRGKIRMLSAQSEKSMAFVTCDRGSLARDVLIGSRMDQNRALDGDTVFVELLDEKQSDGKGKDETGGSSNKSSQEKLLSTAFSEKASLKSEGETAKPVRWRDDAVQRRLWNPLVNVRRNSSSLSSQEIPALPANQVEQRKGKVVYVMSCSNSVSANQPSELNPSDESYRSQVPRRPLVGTLKKLANGGYRFVPNNKALPEFFCKGRIQHKAESENNGNNNVGLYKAEYVQGSWKENIWFPPCERIQSMGTSCNVEDETLALLEEHGVNHGDFTTDVFEDVTRAVDSGLTVLSRTEEKTQAEDNLGWQPTPDMYIGRRDYRNQRIFTIDPTTAKDLDDALHITPLSNGQVEIGVHIADVSHFVQPESAVDEEAKRRGTTVYLVDRTVPMLPRPLCEVACSLNENVERLAFSCVWTMNTDGTMPENGKIWYGKTVIKSCARLDYATAQNIIENKVATGESWDLVDDTLWPRSRRPTKGTRHTIDQVAEDVRLMNVVAKARRRLRFENGALALNGIKLAFQLEEDGETPMLCAPYPIRDSNRLIEEYMLLANFLVAQRLISHTGGLALLRQHEPPIPLGLEGVVAVAMEGMGFAIDASSSQALQKSLSRLGRECDDELVLQCITSMLMTPMKEAQYLAAGEVAEEGWRHFALNIPYYTHFTSPIRRYPDIIVHRLLQASILGEDAVECFPLTQKEIHTTCSHCNDKKTASRKAQDRSDRVFLALYLRRHPLKAQKAVVLSVGQKTFTVFVPSLGLSSLVYLDEHKDKFQFEAYTTSSDQRRIRLEPRGKTEKKGGHRLQMDIRVFAKLSVACTCNEKPPIDVKVKMEGPWTEE